MKHIKTFEDFVEENKTSDVSESVKIKDVKDLIDKLNKGNLPKGLTELKWDDITIKINTTKQDDGYHYDLRIKDADGDTRDEISFSQPGHDIFRTGKKAREFAYAKLERYWKETNESVAVVSESKSDKDIIKIIAKYFDDSNLFDETPIDDFEGIAEELITHLRKNQVKLS
jgi:hypothetical protein